MAAAEPPRRLKAVENYEAKAKGELTLKIGDVIFVPNFDKQKGDMLHGVSAGKVGRFPRHVLEDTTVEHQDGNVTPVRAIHDYTAKAPEELSFPFGAKMFVVKRVDKKWWRGVYNNTDGLIPATHIQADTTRKVEKAESDGSVPAAAMAQSKDKKKVQRGPPVWDWGKLPKERAERELRDEPQGTFLVRASESATNAYAISVVSGKTVRHIRLHSTEEGFAVNKADPHVPTIAQLIGKMMGKSLQVRPTGSTGAKAETKLLVRPLPRLPSGPPPCCWNAKPMVSGPTKTAQVLRPPGAKEGSVDLLKAAASMRPAPKGPPPKKKSSGSHDVPQPAASAPSFPMSDEEKGVYRGLWDRIASGAMTVPAATAAGFFQTSGLENAMLGQIWQQADTLQPNGQLTEPEFYVALKLIALKQSGQSPEVSKLQTKSPIPQLMGHTDVVQAARRAPPPAAATAQPTTTTQAAAPARTSGSAVGSVKWVVQPQEFETYRGFFSGVDKDGDGLVTGAEVMGVFLSSKLSKAVLGQIWSLVDISETHAGLLDVEQFALAMWIIAEQVKGVPVPSTLSDEMVPPSMRAGAGTDTPTAAAAPAPEPAAPTAAAPSGAAVPDFLSVKERAVYNQLWALAVPAGQDHMGPGEAVGFLQASALDNSVLGSIWDIADGEPRGSLVKNEFYVALKLIALCQVGMDISVDNLKVATPLPLLARYTEQAIANGFAITPDQWPAYTALWQSASKGQSRVGPEVVGIFQTSGLDNDTLGEIWEIADAPPDKGVLRDDEFYVALKLIAAKQAGIPVSEEALLQPTGVPKLGETTGQLATRLWARLGVDPSGTADGGALRPVLMESGLEVARLGEVWQLADNGSKGHLTFSEFQVLCGLIGQAQRGEPLNAAIITAGDAAAKFP